MKGVILNFNKEEQSGIIKNEETDSRFSFTKDDFKSEGEIRNGMKVDFVEVEDRATEIYKDVSFAGVDVQNAINNFQKDDFTKKSQALFENGMHNKYGVIISIVMLVSLFLPIIKVNAMGLSQSVSAFSLVEGKIVFVLIIFSAIFFYGGINRFLLKVLNTISVSILFYEYITITNEVYEANESIEGYNTAMVGFFGGSPLGKTGMLNMGVSTQWGLYLGIIICLGLLYFTYLHKPYETNEKTF